MQKIFIDSSFFFALIDKRNQDHQKVKKILQEIRYPLLTSNYIFAETLSLITKRLGKKVGLTFGKSLQKSEVIETVMIDETIHEQAWQMYQNYKDKDFDLIDSSSFALCEAYNIKTALTFDRHFQQMGFETLPF